MSCLRATLCGRRLAKREKTDGSELRSLSTFSGECVKGGHPAPDLAWRSVVGAGFALPRDAGLKTGAPSRPRALRVVAYC